MLHVLLFTFWSGGLVTILGSDGKPKQVPANSLSMPQSLNALPGLANTASNLGIISISFYDVRYNNSWLRPRIVNMFSSS